MYNNPYNNYYGQQTLNDRIDSQIAQLQQMKEQFKNQQPAINQTFQLAPNNHTMKYANTIDDVNKEIVYIDTPFFSKDMSVVWIKNAKGDIKTYELNEIIPQDAKDIQIAYLQEQLNELKGMIRNDANVTNIDTEQNATDTTKYDGPTRTTIEKDKPTSFSKVSTSKKRQ